MGSRIRVRVALTACFLAVYLMGTAEGATFNIVYDVPFNQQIGNIIGTGTFSYDGPATVGSFPFQSLTGLAFTAFFHSGFAEGFSFSTADLLPLSSSTGITVFDAGNDQLGLVFTGTRFGFPSGSLDAAVVGALLSHESTAGVDVRTGRFGNGTINAYSLGVGALVIIDGDYRALAVTEPASLTMLGSGLAIFLTLFSRTHRRP